MNINENKWIENHTERPMIALTLINAETGDYSELRTHMVEVLTEAQMNEPLPTLMGVLEDLVWDMFTKMDDDELQDMYDDLKEQD